MSDTESGDDGFDREAEKERLREKYEAEKKDREATQQMSELLLQGATMTNKHCEECGNPIFRYDGQEFCSVCGDGQQQATGSQQQATGDGQQTTGDEQAVGGGQQTAAGDRQPTDDQSSVDGQHQADDVAAAPTAAESGSADAQEPAGSQPGTHGADADQRGPQNASTGQSAPTPKPPAESTQTGDADLDAARASLARTITEFSRRAEQTRDATHARDLLAAAREAADALAELERLR